MPETRWSEDAAWNWHKKLPPLVGANFLPSTACNQLEMWQAETFDPATIDRELGWAAALGMNVMRVYLHDLLWQQDAAAFAKRIDAYLALADKHGNRTLLTLFDDCWNTTFALGAQPAKKPCEHNYAWVQSPGRAVVNDPSQWPRLEHYVRGVLERFGQDPRVLAWDLYNEPGNGEAAGDAKGVKQGKRSLPLLEATFRWARTAKKVSQPLTAGIWMDGPEFVELNALQLAQSDIITFHCYSTPQILVDRIKELKTNQRPMICTEYMARGHGSNFEFCLPLLLKYGVGAINWGLVAGKSQTIYPWGWTPAKGEPDLWHHDVFWPDGKLLYPREERAIRESIQAAKSKA